MKVRFSMLLSLGLLAACTAVGPNYHKPAAETPGAFKEAPPAGWKTAQPRGAAPRGKWGERFGEPELTAREERVSVSNQTLAQAEAQFRGARAAVAAARAGLFPTVTAGASVTNSRVSASRTTTGTATRSGTATIYQVPIDLSYEFDVWGR